MNENWESCLKNLLQHEGMNDDDPQDPGGRTSRGITQFEYDNYRDRHGQPRRDVWTADDAEVRDIYRTKYWDVLQCDHLPAGVDYAVFDYGVNSGVSRAAKVLQQIIGAAIDGEIGVETIGRAKSLPSDSIIRAMSSERLGFLKQVKTWPRFGKGWSRRVAEVQAQSLKMAEVPPSQQVPTPGQPATSWLSAVIGALMALFRGRSGVSPPVPVPAKQAEPPWMTWAKKEVGFHEIGQNRGIEKYISLGKCGSVGDPWCSIFCNAALESSGVRGSRSALARSFERDPFFVKLDGPALGAITTMWRGSIGSGLGHVFLYAGESEGGRVLALGGNQSDQVCLQYEPRNRIVGYWWPKSVPLPKIGKIIVDSTAGEGTET
jgi:uncharacterized protein (TIGR02594 family)